MEPLGLAQQFLFLTINLNKIQMKKRFLIILLIILISSVFINTYYQSKSEYVNKYAFKISKINITPTKSLEVYEKNKKISFWNFSLRENNNIKVGDYLIKDSCSKFLYIYRKNEHNNDSLYLTLEKNSIFPIEWLCSPTIEDKKN